jgi:hypothetical protein
MNGQSVIITGYQLFRSTGKSGAKLSLAKPKSFIPRINIYSPMLVAIVVASLDPGLLLAVG